MFDEDPPEVTESNNRANDLLRRMRNVIEELHSRFADGFNEFGSDETGVIRLLVLLDELVNCETYDGNGFAFVSTALNTIKAVPMTREPLQQVMERRVPSDLDAARLWLVYSICMTDCLSVCLQEMWDLGEVVDAFYKRSSPIFATKVPFRAEMIKLLKFLHHPHGTNESLIFRLDIGALSSFHNVSVWRTTNNSSLRQSSSSNQVPSAAAANNNSDSMTLMMQDRISDDGKSTDTFPHNLNNSSNTSQSNTSASASATTTTALSSAATVGMVSSPSSPPPVVTQTTTTTAGGKKIIRRVKKVAKSSANVTGGDSSHAVDQQQQNLDSSLHHHVDPSSAGSSVPSSTQASGHYQNITGNVSSAETSNQVSPSKNFVSTSGRQNISSTSQQDQHIQCSAEVSHVAVQAVESGKDKSSTRSFEELEEIDHALTEREEQLEAREKILKESQEEIRKQETQNKLKSEELESKLDSVTKCLTDIKNVFNDLFLVAHESNSENNNNNNNNTSEQNLREQIPSLVPKILALVEGKSDIDVTTTAISITSATAPSTTTTNKKSDSKERTESSIIQNNSSLSSSSSQQQQVKNSSFGATSTVAVVQTSSPFSQASSPSMPESQQPPLNSSFRKSATALLQAEGFFSTPKDGGLNSSVTQKTATTATTAKGDLSRNSSFAGNNSNPSTSLSGSPDTNPSSRNLLNATQTSSRASANLNRISESENNSTNNNNNNDQTQTQTATSSSTVTPNQHLQAVSRARAFTNISFTGSSASGLSTGSGSTSARAAAMAAHASANSHIHHSNLTAGALSAVQQGPSPKRSADGRPLISVAPDTCTTRPSAGIPYIIDTFDESERNVQLEKQRNKCPKCQAEVNRNEERNPLLRSLVNMGQLALQQKPRRCHYTGEIFCHKCHSNKTALIPHKVCSNWDFEEYHVSDNGYDYLANNFERPIIHLPDVPSVASKVVAQQLAQFRRKLNRMHAVLVLCPTIQRQHKSVFTTSYYFSREHWWSLADFVRMRLLEPDAPSNLSRGIPNPDLLQHLGRLLSDALDHINGCGACRERGYGVCTLCTEVGDAKTSFWEDGTACTNCGKIFHASCFEFKGCPDCKTMGSA